MSSTIAQPDAQTPNIQPNANATASVYTDLPRVARRVAWWEQPALVTLLVTFTLVGALYSWVTPPLEGFDAVAYYRAALHLRATGQLPRLDEEAREASYQLIAQPPLYSSLTALALLPWSPAPALALSEELVNPYFDKSLSLRQTVTLPDAPANAVAPIYVAAMVSLLGGLLTVYATWRIGRALVPDQWTFALAAASIVAFNPLFLFLSVTVTNNTLAVGTMAMCVAFAAEAALGDVPHLWHWQGGRWQGRRWLWAGVWGGLAMLTKYSGFAVGLPVAILWLYAWRRWGWRVALQALGLALGGGLLVAGWWFARMVWLYGELIPLQRMDALIATNRATPMPWDAVIDYIPWLIWSYWGVFVAIIAPAAFFSVVRVLMLGGLIGLLPALLRRDGAMYAAKGWGLVMALLWAAVAAAAVLYWTRTVSYGEQGRLAQIGAPAFALLFVLGWQSYAAVRWRPLIHGALVALMLGLALWQSPTLWAAYSLPPAIATPAPQRPLDVHFAGGPRLLGVDLPAGAAVAAGESLPLTLYWTTDVVIPADYTLFLHLADSNDQLLYQFDGVMDKGRHPTRQWLPNQVFADVHTLTVPANTPPGLATLSAGLYPLDDPKQRLATQDGAGNAIGDRVVLAQVYISDAIAATQLPANPVAVWTNGITLAAVTVEQADGLPIGAAFTWHSTATLHQDYTFFAQVLDTENRVLAQIDQIPLSNAPDGARPTATWRSGETFADHAVWTPLPDADLATWDRVIVGWYDASGARLPVRNAPGDFVVIATREQP